jgi:outer membrane receptor protein involved in Fe transport
MDNQAPGLNFSVGNIVGITELDVDNVELLPGASSALYGAGGINGTLLMTSKDPFKYPGASFQYKTGVNHVNDDNSSVQPFN